MKGAGARIKDAETGWVSCWMTTGEDVDGVIEMFRMQYDRYATAAGSNAGR